MTRRTRSAASSEKRAAFTDAFNFKTSAPLLSTAKKSGPGGDATAGRVSGSGGKSQVHHLSRIAEIPQGPALEHDGYATGVSDIQGKPL